MARDYFLKLQSFEGPLDLLLHLIKVHEIDIFDINIFVLSTQYLDYLRVMKFQDLSEAGEFLEMAATLIEIKSKMLLPRQKIVNEDGQIIEEDPRKSLQERLIEYERFKKASEVLEQRPTIKQEFFCNHEWQRLERLFEDVETPLKGDPAALCILFQQMLKTLGERQPTKVHAKRHMMSVEEKIQELKLYMETVKFCLFQGFFNQFTSRYELVVYILAVLELVKSKDVKIHQEDLFGPLWIYKSDSEELPFLNASLLPAQPQIETLKDVPL